jgi:hypothetical protein
MRAAVLLPLLLAAQAVAAQGVPAARIDDLALLVHDVIILEQPLADREIVLLDLFLGSLNALGYPPVLDRHVALRLSIGRRGLPAMTTMFLLVMGQDLPILKDQEMYLLETLPDRQKQTQVSCILKTPAL